MAPWIAGTSTILTSLTLHCAPSAADPSAVIRSTTCVAGSSGGMIGAGGVTAGGWASAFDGVIRGTTASAKHATSCRNVLLHITSSQFAEL